MRVGIIGLQHESNTFVAAPTTIEDFQWKHLLEGEAVRTTYANMHHEVGGFFAGLAEQDIQVVPLFMAMALPSGTIAEAALAELFQRMLSALRKAGPLDGLLVAPHGAAVSQSHRDMDGWWLMRLREEIGPALPMICTLDPHANLSRRMVDACNATIAYRSNPHLDQRARGIEAARLMARTLRGEIRPTQQAAFPPVAINIERQLTSRPPCSMLIEAADKMLSRPKVLSNSVILGFPYADVQEMGSSFVVLTDNDPALARTLADSLADLLVQFRQDFSGRLVSIDEALDQAAKAPGPVCLLDMGDNVGGGSPADGTFLLEAARRRKLARLFVCIYDRESAEQAVSAGVGSRVDLRIGGKSDSMHGQPVQASVTVRSLHEGKFTEQEPRHGGQTHYDMGPTAVVDTEEGQTVMLTSRRMVPFSLSQITSCGLEPADFQIIVAKGVHAPVAAYATVCKQLLRVDTPGVTRADMTALQYQHRRRPLFPFER